MVTNAAAASGQTVDRFPGVTAGHAGPYPDPPQPNAPFEEHVAWARSVPVVGFDLSAIAGRCIEDETPWDYGEAARELVASGGGPVLDLGTGGGELLARLGPFPPGSAATEAWAPNVPVARRALAALGVDVRQVGQEESRLPFFNQRFAVVLDRHDAFDPDEVYRVLQPGGTFLTQQVDSRDGVRISAALGLQLPWDPDEVTAQGAVEVLTEAGFVIDEVLESSGTRRFTDLGAVLWYLKIIAWQVPALADLSPGAIARFEAPLRALHLHFAAGHEFVDEAPRFLVRAHRPQ